MVDIISKESLSQNFLKIKMVKQCHHEKVLYVVVKKSRFSKEQEAKGLWSHLGIKTPLNKIPLLGDILF